MMNIHFSYQDITSIENLFQAWDGFKKGKRKKRDVQTFELNLEDNLFNLHRKLISKSYKHGNYQSFYVHDPKKRHIHKASVEDRILHHLLYKSVRNPRFPYKRYVLCPICEKPLFGSASRGRLGKYYPAYHCNKRGHYFRVPKQEFEETIASFVSNLDIKPKYVKDLKKYVIDLWQEKMENSQKDNKQIDRKIEELRSLAKITADKIKYLESATAIKYIEEELVKTEKEIRNLQTSKVENKEKDVNMERVMEFVGYFLEHLEELILGGSNLLKRADYFGLIFEKPPTYEELVSGTPKLAPFIGLKDDFGSSLVPMCEPGGIRTPNQLLKRELLYH